MRDSFFIVLLFWVNLAFSSHESGLEIKINSFQMFENYVIQYNFEKNNPREWNDLSTGNSSELDNIKYLCGDIDLKNKENEVFLRILKNDKSLVSDIHKVNLRENCTTFLSLSILPNQIAGNNEVVHDLSNYGHLKYYDIGFKIKSHVEESLGVSLLQPAKNVFESTSVLFAWNNSCNGLSSFNSYLLIGLNGQQFLRKINITNLSSYNWAVPSDFLPGMYWWQISCENNQNEIIESEKRVFYIASDLQDTDNDGYSDIEECTRNSDPNDTNDVPLFITSPQICPNANVDQQYFIQLKSNEKSGLTKWSTYSTLPNGLFLSKSGIISGRPKEMGVYFFTVVADCKEKNDELTMSITVDSSGESQVKIEGIITN